MTQCIMWNYVVIVLDNDVLWRDWTVSHISYANKMDEKLYSIFQ